MAKGVVRFLSIRVHQAFLDRLKAEAKLSHRSMQQEVIVLLEEALVERVLGSKKK
jgi:hypothetical protein